MDKPPRQRAKLEPGRLNSTTRVGPAPPGLAALQSMTRTGRWYAGEDTGS